MQLQKRAGLIPVWVVAIDESLLLESRLKSGLGQQQLSGGRGDLQVKLPVLPGSLLPRYLIFAQVALTVELFVFGAGDCETCSERFATLEDFCLEVGYCISIWL